MVLPRGFSIISTSTIDLMTAQRSPSQTGGEILGNQQSHTPQGSKCKEVMVMFMAMSFLHKNVVAIRGMA